MDVGRVAKAFSLVLVTPTVVPKEQKEQKTAGEPRLRPGQIDARALLMGARERGGRFTPGTGRLERFEACDVSTAEREADMARGRWRREER